MYLDYFSVQYLLFLSLFAPINFIYSLGLTSSKPMDFVYHKLLDYEEPYLKRKRIKRRIDI